MGSVMMTALAMVVFQAGNSPVLAFDRQRIGDTTYEACSVCDVNQDGALDIVSGEYWFEGPQFKTRHKICTLTANEDYFDDFSDYPMDVNGDGYPDIVSGAWWGQKIEWRENPKGKPVEWTSHDVAKVGNVERPCFWDIDGDGVVEVVPNTPGNVQTIFKLNRDANGKGTGSFTKHVISDVKTGHGLGFGDVNGDGRGDLVISSGWFEQPAKPMEQEWPFHKDFDLGASASVPILVYDVNGDGMNDLIVGMGHDYGLFWWQQGRDSDSKATWTKHAIETKRSQYHDLALADLDKDGQPELVTGKRYRAHVGHDPGADDPVGLYYFKIDKGAFKRVTIDYGSPDQHSGSGIYLWIADVSGNGWKDIVAAGKEGMYLFRNQGPASQVAAASR